MLSDLEEARNEIFKALDERDTGIVVYVDINEKFRFQCNCSGACCVDPPQFIISAPDVWKIVH